jgi:hypothetical protein
MLHCSPVCSFYVVVLYVVTSIKRMPGHFTAHAVLRSVPGRQPGQDPAGSYLRARVRDSRAHVGHGRPCCTTRVKSFNMCINSIHEALKCASCISPKAG